MYYLTSRMVFAPMLRAVWRPTVTGTENMPRTGGVILASNHLSFMDSVALPAVSPRQVHFLAKSDYFTGTGVKGNAQRIFMTSMGMIPVEREDHRAAIESLDTALSILRDGRVFGIYPEGTRSRDGRLYRGRVGVAHLALEAKVPVVPVGLWGTQNVQPVGASRPKIAKVRVAFGEPLYFADDYAGVPAGRARREITDRVMSSIAALSGQEQAGKYNELPPTD